MRQKQEDQVSSTASSSAESQQKKNQNSVAMRRGFAFFGNFIATTIEAGLDVVQSVARIINLFAKGAKWLGDKASGPGQLIFKAQKRLHNLFLKSEGKKGRRVAIVILQVLLTPFTVMFRTPEMLIKAFLGFPIFLASVAIKHIARILKRVPSFFKDRGRAIFEGKNNYHAKGKSASKNPLRTEELKIKEMGRAANLHALQEFDLILRSYKLNKSLSEVTDSGVTVWHIIGGTLVEGIGKLIKLPITFPDAAGSLLANLGDIGLKAWDKLGKHGMRKMKYGIGLISHAFKGDNPIKQSLSFLGGVAMFAVGVAMAAIPAVFGGLGMMLGIVGNGIRLISCALAVPIDLFIRFFGKKHATAHEDPVLGFSERRSNAVSALDMAHANRNKPGYAKNAIKYHAVNFRTKTAYYFGTPGEHHVTSRMAARHAKDAIRKFRHRPGGTQTQLNNAAERGMRKYAEDAGLLPSGDFTLKNPLYWGPGLRFFRNRVIYAFGGRTLPKSAKSDDHSLIQPRVRVQASNVSRP